MMMSIKTLFSIQRPLTAFVGVLPTRDFSVTSHQNEKKVHPSEPPPSMTLPSKVRLPVISKVPPEFQLRPIKGTREAYRFRGEEKIHTELLLGQYGIVAVHGGLIKTATFDNIRNFTLRKMKKHKKCFAFYRIDPPYKPITRHGMGKKMGGGKGSISTYATPVKAGRVILEVCGDVYWEEVKPWLRMITRRLPFECIAVNKEILEQLNQQQAQLEEANENPYTFEWMVRNNINDCGSFISPYDTKWFGRFVYKDRSNNKKWHLVRQTNYKSREGTHGN